MQTEELPKWHPSCIYITAYHPDSEGQLKIEDVIEKLFQKYGGSYSKDFNRLESKSGPISIYLRGLSERGYIVSLVALGSSESKVEKANSIPSYTESDELFKDMREILPKEPDSICIIRIMRATNESRAKDLLQNYVNDGKQSLISAGIVQSCILATFDSRISSMPMSPKEIIIISYGRNPKTDLDSIWKLSFHIKSLELYNLEMDRLYSDRKLMFDQMDASEDNTQIRINEILAQMRRPIDEIQPSDLENILKDITIQFSRLSTTSSTMRRDYVKARALLRNTKNLLKELDERPIDETKTNSSTRIDYLESLIAPFRDFIERTEALTSQFSTVLDSVRTYLGIQQQKISITEQTSSREQLVRLVNLQEILHKLEILIVAFYLTEMARIVFDSLLHESANLLTVAFIPIALLISVFLSRLLHKSSKSKSLK
jgi:hypothetical protein